MFHVFLVKKPKFLNFQNFGKPLHCNSRTSILPVCLKMVLSKWRPEGYEKVFTIFCNEEEREMTGEHSVKPYMVGKYLHEIVVSSQALTIPSTVAETYMLTSNFGNLCNCSGGEAEALHSL
ncbi:hypothetical protein HID58_020488 [Brassica napus]|uniref:Uncharacterized protein n=1 Tax=Brassica napus TaxID=3708 RepID=A0ABQ7XGN9_BRANA|nr:hypothetical protein HID58_020488 [Brassica napus]